MHYDFEISFPNPQHKSFAQAFSKACGVWGETPTFSADRQEDQLVERQIDNGVGIQLVNGF